MYSVILFFFCYILSFWGLRKDIVRETGDECNTFCLSAHNSQNFCDRALKFLTQGIPHLSTANSNVYHLSNFITVFIIAQPGVNCNSRIEIKITQRDHTQNMDLNNFIVHVKYY